MHFAAQPRRLYISRLDLPPTKLRHLESTGLGKVPLKHDNLLNSYYAFNWKTKAEAPEDCRSFFYYFTQNKLFRAS